MRKRAEKINNILINKVFPFSRDARGAVGIITGLIAFLVFLPLVAVVVDGGNFFFTRTAAQRSLDAATLAASRVLLAAREVEANKIFAANFSEYRRASFTPPVITTSDDGRTVTGSTTIRVPAYFASVLHMEALTSRLTSQVALTALSNAEIAIALDTSLNMEPNLPAAKAALTDAFNSIYSSPNANVSISLIPYTDVVKVDPNYSNGWMVAPSANPNGCIGIRDNRPPYFETPALPDIPPPYTPITTQTMAFGEAAPVNNNAAAHFPTYLGPFGVQGYFWDKPQMLPVYNYTTPQPPVFSHVVEYYPAPLAPSIRYFMAPEVPSGIRTEPKISMRITRRPDNTGVTVQFATPFEPSLFCPYFACSVGNGGRYNAELDYLDNATIGEPSPSKVTFNGSEILSVDYGTEYRGSIGLFRMNWMFSVEDELAGWTAFRGDPAQPVTLGSWQGIPAAPATFDLLNVVPDQPARAVQFWAANKPGKLKNPPYPDGDVGLSWQTSTGDPIRDEPGYATGDYQTHDNSDYGIERFDYLPNCATAQTNFFMSTVGQVTTAINSISQSNTDGPTHNASGISWAWYSLSPFWRGVLPGSGGIAPRDYGTIQKIAILISGNGNAATEDGVVTLGVCDNMRVQGIEIFGISYNAPAETQALLRTCAGDASHYFNSPDGPTLANSLSEILKRLSYPRLVH